MIPDTQNITSISIEKQKSKTYHMNDNKSEVRGDIDGLEAMRQCIYKIIYTERYKYLIYNWNYGIELEDLFGKNYSYVIPEVERRITEALLADDRITDVYDFSFTPNKENLLVTFSVMTDFGVIEIEKKVNINV